MTPLEQALIRRIRAEGPMTVAEYMSLCLTHPEHGYYTTRDPFGGKGDFITAPEVSQMFGELIGLALAQYWMDVGRPDPFVLAELGPGRGTLMADALRATAAVPGFHRAVTLCLVEASGVLRDVQKAALSGYDVQWVDGVDRLPDGPLFLVANEFFDAIPIRQFLRKGDGWVERLIGLDDAGELAFGLGPQTAYGLLQDKVESTKEGDIVEVSAGQTALMGEVGQRIAEHGGLALVIDYGDWGTGADTLQALAGHRKVGPLDLPGQSDLTAHVDFSALAKDLPEGATHSKLMKQGEVLACWGIVQRAEALAENLESEALQSHVAAFHRLTSADEMGSLFRMMAVTQSGTPGAPGFDYGG